MISHNNNLRNARSVESSIKAWCFEHDRTRDDEIFYINYFNHKTNGSERVSELVAKSIDENQHPMIAIDRYLERQ